MHKKNYSKTELLLFQYPLPGCGVGKSIPPAPWSLPNVIGVIDSNYMFDEVEP